MPAWPGGPCPQCGDDMPEMLVHCQSCRALLNDDLESDSVEIPAFVPLQEVESMFEVEPAGYYVACPECGDELRVNRKYIGNRVACRHCDAPFLLTLSDSPAEVRALFAPCPSCNQQLRAAMKYLGMKVACKHCGERIHFLPVN